MDKKLEIVKERLIANSIVDFLSCKAKTNEVFFETAYVSSYKKFRFTTPVINQIFGLLNNKKGFWKNGISILYEIENNKDLITCKLLTSNVDYNDERKFDLFLKSNAVKNEGDLILIKSWTIYTPNSEIKDLNKKIEYFYNTDLKNFEKELQKWINNNDYLIYDDNYELIEGAIKNISTNKYERNREARQKCIDYYGSSCKICGFDFGQFYGSDLEGKIEVHHIKPISEIGENYIVDPINDLIPVCPNCHLVLHSNKNKVYSPEEVNKMINKN